MARRLGQHPQDQVSDAGRSDRSAEPGFRRDDRGRGYGLSRYVRREPRIKIAEIHDNNIGRNADELLRKVEAAQFVASHDGEVCPAKWKKGEATLKPSIDLVGKI